MASYTLSAVKLEAGALTLEMHPELGGALTRFVHESSRGPLDVFRPTRSEALAGRDILGVACSGEAPGRRSGPQ
jgi:hypothetical protein